MISDDITMLLEWPLQSTELNIIENLYVDIKMWTTYKFFFKKNNRLDS